MKKEFNIEITRKAKDFRKVFSELPNDMDDNKYYMLRTSGSVFHYLQLLWYLRFPKRKPIFKWISMEEEP